MKNANVFIDVDLTMVDQNGKLLPGVRSGLALLLEKGCHLYLWSTCGVDYCRNTAKAHKLEEFFEGYAAKPDIIVDDMPFTVLNPFHFDVNRDGRWERTAQEILRKHID